MVVSEIYRISSLDRKMSLLALRLKASKTTPYEDTHFLPSKLCLVNIFHLPAQITLNLFHLEESWPDVARHCNNFNSFISELDQ